MATAFAYGLIISGAFLVPTGLFVVGKTAWTLYKMYKKYGLKGMFKK